MKFKFQYKKQNIELDVRPVSIYNTGLMFCSKKTKPLLFNFKKPSRFKITSLFVFFTFVAVWLDDKNNVLEIRKVKPFTFSVKPIKKVSKLLEIPLNCENRDTIGLLVDD